MTPDKIIVTLGGLAAIAFIVWFFWLATKAGVKAGLSSSGYQEVMILVKGGYTPDVIVVESGKPVRLEFRREETAACSEQVLFPDFGKAADLPEGENVAVELPPSEPGEYGFECGMGMLHGKLLVR